MMAPQNDITLDNQPLDTSVWKTSEWVDPMKAKWIFLVEV